MPPAGKHDPAKRQCGAAVCEGVNDLRRDSSDETAAAPVPRRWISSLRCVSKARCMSRVHPVSHGLRLPVSQPVSCCQQPPVAPWEWCCAGLVFGGPAAQKFHLHGGESRIRRLGQNPYHATEGI
jgi:hypothetical protein